MKTIRWINTIFAALSLTAAVLGGILLALGWWVCGAIWVVSAAVMLSNAINDCSFDTEANEKP